MGLRYKDGEAGRGRFRAGELQVPRDVEEIL